MNYHKIVLVGPEGAGKTSLFERFKTSSFVNLHNTTVGASFTSHTTFLDGRKVKLNVWDTAGQERFNSFLPMYIRESSAILLCLHEPDYNVFNFFWIL